MNDEGTIPPIAIAQPEAWSAGYLQGRADAAEPEGWRWECASCDRPVPPMGMCETCGVFGIMRICGTTEGTPEADRHAWLHA